MTDSIIDIPYLSLALGYLLLLIPLALILIYRVGIAGDFIVSVVRMSVQLLFVGFYLQIVFTLNRWWLTLLWFVVMIVVADLSVLRGSRLSARLFFVRMFVGIGAGILIPLVFFIMIILQIPHFMEPQYLIPIAGMIMGNCLRANIIGVGRFYVSLKEKENAFLYSLSQGATLREAVRPFMRKALSEALAPTIATMMTIGLVSLPGMMTGILMAGADPTAAIKYQIAIMIAIFTGTAITIVSGIELTLPVAFTAFGNLRPKIFK